jgi:hypothetical protein
MTKHLCHARECRTPVPPVMLMCRDHWEMVPGRLKKMVLENYRHGQCDDKRVSKAWLEAADAAIGWIALKEGKPLTKVEVRCLVVAGYKLSIIREYLRRGASETAIARTLAEFQET